MLMLIADSLCADRDFTDILTRSEQLYGTTPPEALHRIKEWQTLLYSQHNIEVKKQLDIVNRFFNRRLRFRDDIVIWNQEDYWASPVEALRKGAADCEDYAIAKYFTLRHLGVPGEKLRITYVKALHLNKAHMVLTYYPTPTVARREILHCQARNSAQRGMVKSVHFAQCKIDSIFLAIKC
ncbi:transglutaminase-like cysteine peptidase [Morganella morganii]|nr:transglutaminase-like cysteine peptidase [Morganella morganii]